MPDRKGSGKVAWVTGGTHGIGRAISVMLADLGYTVVNSARNADPFCEECDDIRWSGGQSTCIIADVTDRAAVNSARDLILKRFGRLDVLVNSVGFNVRQRSWADLLPDEFDEVIATNLTGTFNAIHAVLPTMRAQKAGIIVNMSSTAAKQVNPEGGVAYTIAKTGVHIMTRMLNQSELRSGIRACVIAPGGVDTRAHEWRPEEQRAAMLRPEDVARAVRYAIEQPEGTAVWEIELTSAPG